MGKRSRTRHEGDEIDDKQPSCMWGIIHILDYHYWRSSVRNVVHNSQYKPATPLSCNRSPEIRHGSPDAQEIEELLDVEATKSYHNTKRSQASNRWSIKGRIKSLIAEDFYKQKYNSANEISLKSNLQRRDSMHHFESLSVEYETICTDWKHKVVFIPESVVQKVEEDNDYNEETGDILEIFKVDKNLFMRQVHNTDKSVIDSSLDLNVKAKFSKSRSFPVVELSQGVKLKPRKLENKQIEVWPFLKEDMSQVSGSCYLDPSSQHYRIKRSHHRSLSFNESLERKTKLHASKSLKFENENGHGPVPFRRIHSLSCGGSNSSELNISMVGGDISMVGGDKTLSDLNITTRVGGKQDEGENIEKVEYTEEKLKVLCQDDEIGIHAKVTSKELQDVNLVSDSETCKDETESHFLEFQFSQGSENFSYSDELTSSINAKTKTCLLNEENCFKTHNLDMYYVQQLLEQSGIETASDDQQLGPRVFEKVEVSWPHDQEELDGWPNFDGWWHHMMLFHLVNEMLLETYDSSRPYYLKPLSHSSHVRSLPWRKNIMEEVITKISNLVNADLVGMESLDYVVSRDLECNRSWLNLQFESECIGLEIEDVIFDEILTEIVSL